MTRKPEPPFPKRLAVFHQEFREDLRFWVANDRKIALRALDIGEDVLRSPLQGLGKPEPLKYLASGTWSRRLTQEHRIVYLVTEDRYTSSRRDTTIEREATVRARDRRPAPSRECPRPGPRRALVGE